MPKLAPRPRLYLMMAGLVIAAASAIFGVVDAEQIAFVELLGGASVLAVNGGADARVNGGPDAPDAAATPDAHEDNRPPAIDPAAFVQRVMAAEHDDGVGLDALVGYEELSRRMLGAPCPQQRNGCIDYWTSLSEEERGRLIPLLRTLIRQHLRRGEASKHTFSVTSTRSLEGELVRVRTHARLETEPSLLVDYVVRRRGERFFVVDIITEGSDLATNYYDQIDRCMRKPEQGFPYLVTKIERKIAGFTPR